MRRRLQGKCGLGFGKTFLQGSHHLEVGIAFRHRTRGGRHQVFGSAAQFLHGPPQQFEIMARDAFRAATANKFHAPILAHFRAAPHQYDANLPSALNVRTAARLQIRAFDFDGAEDAFAVDFLANALLRQLVRGSVTDIDRAILKDNSICGALGSFKNFISRFRTSQINRAHFRPQMERNCRQAEPFLKHSGQQMLAGVLLHVIEAPRPMDAAVYVRTRWLAIDYVQNLVAFIAHVDNICIADFTQIVRLSTRRRVERRAIQQQPPDRSCDPRAHIRRQHFAVHHPGREFFFKRVVVIESARGHASSPPADCSARCHASAYL